MHNQAPIRPRFLRILVGVLMGLLLTGCVGCTTKVMWRESSRPGHWRSAYDRFDGAAQTRFRAQEGQVITLEYEIVVDEGVLTAQIVDPEGEALWSQAFREHTSGSTTFKTPQTGRYKVRVEAEQTAGRFAFAWWVE